MTRIAGWSIMFCIMPSLILSFFLSIICSVCYPLLFGGIVVMHDSNDEPISLINLHPYAFIVFGIAATVLVNGYAWLVCAGKWRARWWKGLLVSLLVLILLPLLFLYFAARQAHDLTHFYENGAAIVGESMLWLFLFAVTGLLVGIWIRRRSRSRA